MQTFKKQTNTYQPGLSKKDFMLITRPITMSSQHNLFEVVLLQVFIVVGVVMRMHNKLPFIPIAKFGQ